MSVACAVVLYEARGSRIRAMGRHGDLSPDQQQTLTAAMLLRHKVGGFLYWCYQPSRLLVQPEWYAVSICICGHTRHAVCHAVCSMADGSPTPPYD